MGCKKIFGWDKNLVEFVNGFTDLFKSKVEPETLEPFLKNYMSWFVRMNKSDRLRKKLNYKNHDKISDISTNNKIFWYM